MKTRWLALVAAVVVSSFVGGCGATSLRPGAGRVMVTRAQAPEGCVYLGTVIGNQGGALSGAYTSNADLAEGAVNDLKNKAHSMGANYVVLENTQAGTTISGSGNSVSGHQTDVTHMGNAFRCPAPAPAPAPAAAGNGSPAIPVGPNAASHVVIVRL